MTEEDIMLQYITPAITSKWSVSKITMETKITDGRVNLKSNFAFREKPKQVNHLLYLSANNSIVEEKSQRWCTILSVSQILEVLSFSLPPLAAQKYTVARLKKILTLCEQLK